MNHQNDESLPAAPPSNQESVEMIIREDEIDIEEAALNSTASVLRVSLYNFNNYTCNVKINLQATTSEQHDRLNVNLPTTPITYSI
jgi:hypothetical protein